MSDTLIDRADGVVRVTFNRPHRKNALNAANWADLDRIVREVARNPGDRALVLFCLLASSSFLYLELYATFTPAAAEVRLQKLRAWLDTHTDQVLVAVFLLLGFWLAGKSIYLLVAA